MSSVAVGNIIFFAFFMYAFTEVWEELLPKLKKMFLDVCRWLGFGPYNDDQSIRVDTVRCVRHESAVIRSFWPGWTSYDDVEWTLDDD